MMNSDVLNTIYSEMDEKDQKEFRKWLGGVLKTNKVSLTFIKKDGTERKMSCTLLENLIPQEFAPKNSGKTKSEESLAVFDLEKQGWRSFRWDSVKRIEFNLGNDEKTA